MATYEKKEYIESDAVRQAKANLEAQQALKPGAYQSQWQQGLNDILNKIQNREPFTYDINGDALYQQYKDRYVQQGQQAMMDTMGQAAALTGGYGNSYAQTVGQQTYQGYLQGLNDKIPELYEIALGKYQMEGDDLMSQYGLMADREQTDYGRHRDSVSDFMAELNRLQGIYDSERSYDYGKYSDDRNFDYQLERDRIADEQWLREFEEAKRQYDQQYALAAAKSSGGGGGGGGGGSSSAGYAVVPAIGNVLGVADTVASAVKNVLGSRTSLEDKLNEYISNGAKKSDINSLLRAELEAGTISRSEYDKLKATYAPAGKTY